MENTQFGWIPRLSWKHNNGEFIFGGEFSFHKSNHWGAINFGENLPAGLTKDYYYYFLMEVIILLMDLFMNLIN